MFVGFPPRQAYRGERIFVDEITTVQRFFFFFQTSAHNSDSQCGHGSQIRSVLFSCCCVVLEGVLPCFLCFLTETLAGFLCFSCRVPCLCLGFSLQLKVTSKNTWNTFAKSRSNRAGVPSRPPPKATPRHSVQLVHPKKCCGTDPARKVLAEPWSRAQSDTKNWIGDIQVCLGRHSSSRESQRSK